MLQWVPLGKELAALDACLQYRRISGGERAGTTNCLFRGRSGAAGTPTFMKWEGRSSFFNELKLYRCESYADVMVRAKVKTGPKNLGIFLVE